ncbi:S9 family peptidase [Micromonospora sp. WMMD736]|uniref:S9 family peptidase n=1 Tax=Micromonospora sp. WMMD736 TaxID=3404112 RepID=UPI003B92DC6F
MNHHDGSLAASPEEESVELAPESDAVSAASAVRASIGFDQLRRVGDALYWLESRPSCASGPTLVRWSADDGVADVTPTRFAVTSNVHAYGGGTYAPSSDEVWCAGANGLYRVAGGNVSLIVEDSSSFGDLTIGNGELLAVRETDDGDALVAVPLVGAPAMRVLAETSGFFGAPQPGPGMLAWLRWSERDMPWDSSELWVAPYGADGLLGDPVKLAGGPTESVVEPRWGPDGALYFASDRSGWWNLYRWDGESVSPVAPLAAECAAEPWELGYSSYGFLVDGRIVMVVQEGPRHCLAVVDRSGAVTPVKLPYTSIKPYLAVGGASVALVGSSPAVAPQVALVHLGDEPRVEVLARAEHPGLDGLTVSTPVELRVPVEGSREVVALVYPPTGAAPDWCAPVIVRAHPGPTASCLVRLDWQAQFFTSRGFAVADVDYTGSTGYGRAFRQALYGRWGIDDVKDCGAVAEYLLTEGRAVPGEVFIRGASAGGYTALHAVAQDGPFAAATAVSAIVNPERWAETVPRFQRAHAARLRGGAGRVRAEDIRRPVLMIHGTADDVATADDVRELADELQGRGVPHELMLLDGVGHYVATSAHAARALEAELAHYRSAMAAVASG